MQWSHKVLVVLIVRLGVGEADYWWMQTPAFQGDSGGTEESQAQVGGGGYGDSSSQQSSGESQNSDLKLNNNNPFFTTAESSNDYVETVSDNLVELPWTQCPDTMQCVNDMFCDATGSMVQYRVQLTSEERARRGSLIPCMNQVTRQFEVCCMKTESLTQQLQSSPSTIEQQPARSFPPQQFEDQLSPQSCPVLTSLPPLSQCGGRHSNCWSVGVADLDCQNNALCCFDGCANVCQGTGPAVGNPGVAGQPRSQELRTESKSDDPNNVITDSKSDDPNNVITDSKSDDAKNVITDRKIDDANNVITESKSDDANNIVTGGNKLVGPQTAGSQSPLSISPQIYGASLGSNNLCQQNNGLENSQPQNLLGSETAEQTTTTYTYSEEVSTNTEPTYAEYTETEKNTVTANYQSILFPKDAPENEGYYNTGYIVTAPVKTISPLSEYNIYKSGDKQEPLVLSTPQSNVVILEIQEQTTTTRPQQVSDLTPWVLCPGAMKCVPRENCDLNGIMVEQKLILTKELESLRGPLIPCINFERENAIDVCCRDPNYNDNWQDMSGNDGQYEWEESSTQQPLLLDEFPGVVTNQILQTEATEQVAKRVNAYGK